MLLDPAPLDQARLAEHGAARGAALFEAAASVLGAASRDRVASAGAGWALADLARHASASAERMMAQDAAREQLAAALDGRWSRAGRALGALAHGARLDLAGVAAGSPRRTWRLLRHRLTGR